MVVCCGCLPAPFGCGLRCVLLGRRCRAARRCGFLFSWLVAVCLGWRRDTAVDRWDGSVVGCVVDCAGACRVLLRCR